MEIAVLVGVELYNLAGLALGARLDQDYAKDGGYVPVAVYVMLRSKPLSSLIDGYAQHVLSQVQLSLQIQLEASQLSLLVCLSKVMVQRCCPIRRRLLSGVEADRRCSEVLDVVLEVDEKDTIVTISKVELLLELRCPAPTLV